ncbi:Signal recognition particle alu RNA binding heterodimer, SRP9/14 [Glarea lozoyensis ATCC 20868]|uniref:Signal recognition particle subunit SRP14 n=1 Tax=Glarea lozoyensis (strain ATCC 20868 / MF5171) TaxID=1116229 RepID=S3CP05_GLAL2|nr:Signal recognition particle alu RNA binding heterodimer, SRP9/14 [Glarea lozoyensis ATCC 20868]EPE26894.1 Signal recognition particle alu RNA binding heterodimer, SRP9/14 [Glarea lozoyensis ATCC 20868]
MTKPLSNDEFFTQLTSLFQSTTHGSVYLTQKRMPTPQSAPSPTAEVPFPDLAPSAPTSILIRATNGENAKGRKEGKKVKLSTVVESEAIEGFYARYAEVCKGGMVGGLKKRDRSKAKEKLKAKKRKMGGEVKVEGKA